MDARTTMRVMFDTMDAYDARDFERLAELYAQDVRWLGSEPGRWDCGNREDVFSMFRARMDAGIHVAFEEMRSTPHQVILTSRVGDSDPIVSVVDVEDGRIVRVQDYPSVEAAEDALA